MARHTGKNGVVKVGGTAVDSLVGFDITEQVKVEDTTAALDDWEDHETTTKSWSGSVTLRASHGADGQTLRAGDLIAFEGYTESDATGKTYLSGNATVADHALTHSYDSVVERKYSITGKGALSVEEVA
jgi:hypothetical protein